MSDDLLTKFDRAAAQPGREVPFSAIERRLHVRRSRRRGGIVLSACAIVAGVITTFAFTGGDGPSVETVHPAAQTVTSGQPPFSVELPDGWVESSSEPFTNTAIVVGTASVDLNGHIADGCSPLGLLSESSDDVFVRIFDTGPLFDVILGPRPDDFSTATPSRTDDCVPGGHDLLFDFSDQSRPFEAILTVGASASSESVAEGFGVLNSLKVTPFEPMPVPVTTVPPSTVPPSAETEAITAAFEGWISVKPPNFDNEAAFVEDWVGIRDTAVAAAEAVGNPQCYTGRVDAITRVGENNADVIFTFLCDGQPASIVNQPGRAVKVNGVWMVSRETACAAYAVGGYHCPPRE